MAGSNINQNTFLHGELAPSTHGATESELYNHGLAVCKNTYINQTGSLFRRSGAHTCQILNEDENKYVRRFYTAYNEKEQSVLLALSINTIEIYSLYSGRLSRMTFRDLTVDAWNKGFNFQVINYENYIFFGGHIYQIKISEKNKIDIIYDYNIPIIYPQSLSNVDDTKYIYNIKLIRNRPKEFSFSMSDGKAAALMKNTPNCYFSFFFDLEKKEPEKETQITLTYQVMAKVYAYYIALEKNSFSALFDPIRSSFTKIDKLKELEGRDIYKYTVPVIDIPTSTCFYKGRLYMLDTKNRCIYGSALGSFPFDFSRGMEDTSGLIYAFNGTQELYWILASDQALFVGTSDGIMVMDAAVPSPSSFTFRLMSTTVPAKTICPIAVNSSVFFVDNTGCQVWEIAKDEINGTFKTYNIGLVSQHLLNPGITSIAYSAYPVSTLCCTLRNGTFLLMGYNRSNDIYAWTRHELGGKNARVNAVDVYRQDGRDYFVMDVTRALSDGSLRRSIEYIDNNFHLAPSDKYETNYLDSSSFSMKKAEIKNMQIGYPSTFRFDIAPSKIYDPSMLLLTSSSDEHRVPLIISSWAYANNKELMHLGEEAPFPDEIKPAAQMYQCVNKLTKKATLTLHKDGSLSLSLKGQSLQLNKGQIIVYIPSGKLKGDYMQITPMNSKNLAVYKYVITYDKRVGDVYTYKVVILPAQRAEPPVLADDIKLDVTNYVWYNVGSNGVFSKGKDTVIVYKMLNRHTLGNGIGLSEDRVTLVRPLPSGSEMRYAFMLQNNKGARIQGAVATQRHVYTNENVYTLPDEYDKIAGINNITADGKVLVYAVKYEDNSITLLDIVSNKEIQSRRFYQETLLEVSGYKDRIIFVTMNERGIMQCSLATTDLRELDEARLIHTFTEGETLVKIEYSYLLTSLNVINYNDTNNIKKSSHPLNTGIRCFYPNIIGGVSGSVYATKNNDRRRIDTLIPNNRNFTIIYIKPNGDYINFLSAYGEVFQVNRNNFRQKKIHRLTGVTDVQVVEDFMLADRECLGKIIPGTDICVAQKRAEVLIKDIKSFDVLNDVKVLPINNDYNEKDNVGYLTIGPKILKTRYAYDDTIVRNGNLYFKVYSIRGLSHFHNENVQVTCDGREVLSTVVTKDHVYFPAGGYVLRCGYGYAQEITTLDLQGGSVKGSSVGLIARQFTLCLRVLGSSAGKYSSDGFKWYPIPYWKMMNNVHEQSGVYSGLVKMTMPNSVRDINSRVLYLYNAKAEPLNVLSITRDTYVSDN